MVHHCIVDIDYGYYNKRSPLSVTFKTFYKRQLLMLSSWKQNLNYRRKCCMYPIYLQVTFTDLDITFVKLKYTLDNSNPRLANSNLLVTRSNFFLSFQAIFYIIILPSSNSNFRRITQTILYFPGRFELLGVDSITKLGNNYLFYFLE